MHSPIRNHWRKFIHSIYWGSQKWTHIFLPIYDFDMENIRSRIGSELLSALDFSFFFIFLYIFIIMILIKVWFWFYVIFWMRLFRLYSKPILLKYRIRILLYKEFGSGSATQMVNLQQLKLILSINWFLNTLTLIRTKIVSFGSSKLRSWSGLWYLY